MLIDEQFQRHVGYVVDGADPAGTVFFVHETLGPGYGDVQYAITCRHLIDRFVQAGRAPSLRVNDVNGVCYDVPTDLKEWIVSDRSDVAVTRIGLPPEFPIWTCPVAESDPAPLYAGHDVFFVGMSSLSPGFGSIQAVVRTGRIARASSEVPIEMAGVQQVVSAHLVEFRSWGGQSGSPVFFYEENATQRSRIAPPLLGLLHGQLYNSDSVVDKKDVEIGGIDANAGIGVIIPASEIRHVLMDARLVEARTNEMEERVLSLIRPPGAGQ